MKPVRVVWVDSLLLDDGGWLDVADVADAMTLKGMRHESVGYLVAENDHAIALASSRNAAPGSGANENTRACGVVVIPLSSVVHGPVTLREPKQ